MAANVEKESLLQKQRSESYGSLPSPSAATADRASSLTGPGCDPHSNFDRTGTLYFLSADNTAEFAITEADPNKQKQQIVTSPVLCLPLLGSRAWNIRAPELIISVTGGALDFDLRPPMLRRSFMKGLVTTALDTKAWIITGGTDTGVMKYVGNARERYGWSVPCIGIVTYGIVKGRENITPGHKSHIEYRPANRVNDKTGSLLNPQHSHFIMVNDNSVGEFGREIEFRAQLESAIRKKHNCPAVCIVVQGGVGTAATAKAAIENDTPVILVKGSGGAADLMTNAVEHFAAKPDEVEGDNDADELEAAIPRCRHHLNTTTNGNALPPEKICPEIWEMVKKFYPALKDEVKITVANNVLAVVRVPALINTFALPKNMTEDESSTALGGVVLRAVIRQARYMKQDLAEQWKIAIKWNRVDIAQTEIVKNIRPLMTDADSWYEALNRSLNTAVLDALEAGSVDFITQLIQQGAKVREMFDVKLDSYAVKLGDQRELEILKSLSSAYKYANIERKRSVISMEAPVTPLLEMRAMVNRLDPRTMLLYLYKNEKLNHYEYDSETHKKWNEIWKLTALDKQESALVQFVANLVDKKFSYAFGDVNPFYDLMVWAIVTNHLDLAFFFAGKCTNPVFTTCSGAALLKQISLNFDVKPSLQQKIQEMASIFENFGASLVTAAQLQQEDSAIQCLERPWPFWDNDTCLDIVIRNSQSQFIQKNDAICTKALKMRWNPGFRPAQRFGLSLPLWVMIGILCPFAIPLIAFDGIAMFQFLKRTGRLESRDLYKCEDPAKGPSDFLLPGDFSPTIQHKLSVFYAAPLTRIFIRAVSYIIFLALYTMMVVSQMTNTISTLEYLLITWVISMAVEEVQQLRTSHQIKDYFDSFWNILDVTMVTLFFTAFIAHCFRGNSIANLIYSIDAILFYTRLLNVFSVHRRLGPLLVAVGRMVTDILAFFVFFGIVVFSFGVAFKGIFTQESPDSLAAEDALERVYWNLYGQLYMGDVEKGGTAVTILFAIYLVVAVTIMLTLLIAILTTTYEKVRSESNVVWFSQTHQNIGEFVDCHVVPPPLALLFRMFEGVQFVFERSLNLFRIVRGDWLEEKAKTVFNTMDAFQLEKLNQLQLQSLLNGLAKVRSPEFVDNFYKAMHLEGKHHTLSEDIFVTRKAFVDGVLKVCSHTEALGITTKASQIKLLQDIEKAESLSETRWERDERRRLEEFEVSVRRKLKFAASSNSEDAEKEE